MRRLLKTLAILVLVVLMPLRAVASVTVGVCATGHGEAPVAAHSDHGHGHDAGAHHEPADTSKSGAPTCSSCVEHCSGAAFAPSADAAVAAPIIDGDPFQFAGRIAPAFFTDQLDRPPLAEPRQRLIRRGMVPRAFHSLRRKRA